MTPSEPPQPRYALDLRFVGDEEIAALNRDYRHKNKPTDVLSFSLWEGDDAPPPMQEMPLGDLVISIETAACQAEEQRHSLAREIEFLTVHGTLHLCGLDHHRVAERAHMRAREAAAMRACAGRVAALDRAMGAASS